MPITINRDGQHFGPYSAEEAAAHIASGGLVATDWAWTDGMTDWKPLSEVLTTLQAPPVPPVPEPENDPYATMVPPAVPEPEDDPYATITTPKPPQK